MKKDKKIRILVRTIQIQLVVITIMLTRLGIDYARIERGYDAIGGEYLIPVLGFMSVIIIEDVYREYEEKRRKKYEMQKKAELSIQNCKPNR